MTKIYIEISDIILISVISFILGIIVYIDKKDKIVISVITILLAKVI